MIYCRITYDVILISNVRKICNINILYIMSLTICSYYIILYSIYHILLLHNIWVYITLYDHFMYFFHYNLLCGSRDLYAVKGYSICVIIKCAQALLVVFITWPESRHWGYLRQRHPEHPRRLRCQPERFGFGVKQRAYVGQHNVLWGVLWIASLPVASWLYPMSFPSSLLHNSLGWQIFGFHFISDRSDNKNQ